MQTEPSAKQQIAQAIKNSTNILVTVGRNPSVDSLSAALSLTLMLNRLDKHATAVFSGEIPPAISFLEPGKTFENTVDSLRDFIIALDKEKADRLRYKVEDDVVRIFITPYRTVISEKDLQFSQGDFNVELIIALGVEQREDLDAAITAHGRILHDATVVTINADAGTANLGSANWSDASASSLSEMLMSLSESLQSGLLDQQIATAVLTGIVASTDRFRNERTSPKVMTMAAQLMAAGANQQLIAAKLEEANALPAEEPDVEASDGTTKLSEGQSQKVKPSKKKQKKNDGSLEITHQPKADAAPVKDPSSEALEKAEDELAEQLEKAAPAAAAPTLSVEDLKTDLESAAEDVEKAAAEPVVPDSPKIIKQERRKWQKDTSNKPTFGGTLNATASDAEEAKREEEESRRNEQILHHDVAEPAAVPAQEPVTVESPVPQPVETPVMPELSLPSEPVEPTQPKPLESTSDDALSFEATPLTFDEHTPAPAVQDEFRDTAAEDARAAVDAALSGMPFNPAGKPVESAGATPVFDLSHDNPTVPAPPQPVTPDSFTVPGGQPVVPAEPPIMPPSAPSLPPLPDFSTLPPLPDDVPPVPNEPAPTSTPSVPVHPAPQTPPPAPVQQPPAAPSSDPGQFKIPGQ